MSEFIAMSLPPLFLVSLGLSFVLWSWVDLWLSQRRGMPQTLKMASLRFTGGLYIECSFLFFFFFSYFFMRSLPLWLCILGLFCLVVINIVLVLKEEQRVYATIFSEKRSLQEVYKDLAYVEKKRAFPATI